MKVYSYSFDQIKKRILALVRVADDTGDAHVPGGYNRRTQKKGGGGCPWKRYELASCRIPWTGPAIFVFVRLFRARAHVPRESTMRTKTIILSFDFARTFARMLFL
jgi:hypothetical protein